MNSTILTTKLFVPNHRPGMVTRSHLVEQLNSGQNSKLILISAPAGYGKTTLLTEWIHQLTLPIGWISLDVQDNDLRRFFSYLIASLKSTNFPIKENIFENQKDLQPEKISDFLSFLLNQIAASSQSAYLVLDDYHRITNSEIHQVINYMLEHLPHNLRLVLATRSDPLLRLAKLRSRGELCEIRANDLRFSYQEAAEYFNEKIGLGLLDEDILSLIQKTEGWIVGLQLASISLQKLPDTHQFIRSFAGDDRYIADYLFDEAFNRQPDHIQNFLLQTSILERFNASLGDAVTQQNDSQAILSELERANLFLVPMDNQRNWYRYHHLFGELLQNRLKKSHPDLIQNLHKRASIWFEENNLLADSINHAIEANDVNLIVKLTEKMAIHKMDAGELKALIDWLNLEPDTTFKEHPWLLVARTWADLNTGEFDRAEEGTNKIDNILANRIKSQEIETRIRGHIAAIRSYLAEIRSNDPETAIQAAETALALLPEEEIHLRSFVAIRWANCLSWKGDFPKAIQALREAGNASKLAGEGHLAVNALSEMAILQMHTGQLNQANQDILTTKDYAEMLVQKDGRLLPSMGILYRHLANIKYELNELEDALNYAQLAVDISKECGDNEALFMANCVLGKIYFGLRDYDKFETFFQQGIQIAEKYFPEVLLNIISTKNNFLLLQGNLEETENFTRKHGLKTDDQFDFTKRLMYQNYARLLEANEEYEQAMHMFTKLLKVIEQSGTTGFWIKVKILQTKILHKMKQQDEALKSLKQSLEKASPEGYKRSYLDEGEVIAQLLYLAAQNGIYPEYCKILLDEFSLEDFSLKGHSTKHGEMVESLSEREIDVLELIAVGLSNQEIAAQLSLSLYTVKSHARNIFGKLGVKNRTEAVAKARLYGLLSED